MLLEAVYKLWYLDVKARRRFQIQTILIAFAYSVFNSMALGRPETRVTWETLGLICFLTVGFTLFYCVRTGHWKVSSAYARLREFVRIRGFLEIGLASVVVLLAISFVRYLPNKEVQAVSLDLKLRQAISSQPLDTRTFDTITKVVTTSASRQVPLNPRLVDVAGTKLMEESRKTPDAWQATLSVLSYRSSLNKEMLSFPPRATCIATPNASGISVEVSDSTLDGCTQDLDHIAWKNVVFKNATIVYHGSATVLENVRFENCRFDLSYNLPSIQLGQTLLASKNVTITLPGS